MGVINNPEELEAVCVNELLPVVAKAYGKKVEAFARHWHDNDPNAVPDGGRNYATFRAFVIDCSKHPAGRYHDGPFLSIKEMKKAAEKLAKKHQVLKVAPDGIPKHPNVRWFSLAVERFIESSRFEKRPSDLVKLRVLYRGDKGIYLVEPPAKKTH